MLLPEAPLDMLIDQLGKLPVGDRRAILALLSRGEREAVRARIRGSHVKPRSPFSADIAAVIEAGDRVSITPPARAALAAALAAMPEATPATGSLIEAFGSVFRRPKQR